MRVTARCFVFFGALIAVIATLRYLAPVATQARTPGPALSVPVPTADPKGPPRRLPPRPILPPPVEVDSIPPLSAEDQTAVTPDEIRRMRGLEDWDQFYRALAPSGLSYDRRMELIVDRLQRERGWSDEDCRILQDALLEEDAEATNRAEKAGITEARFKAVLANYQERLVLNDRFRVIREEVRKERDAEFRSRFGDSDLALIREHLRNGQIWCCGEYGPGYHWFLVRSGGK